MQQPVFGQAVLNVVGECRGSVGDRSVGKRKFGIPTRPAESDDAYFRTVDDPFFGERLNRAVPHVHVEGGLTDATGISLRILWLIVHPAIIVARGPNQIEDS